MSGAVIRLVYYLVIAFVIGTVAQLVTGYRKRRIFTTLLLGFIGVLIGDFAYYRMNLPPVIEYFGISIFWSAVGSISVIVLYRLLRGHW